jgi:methionine-gamma-lyase
MPRTQQTQAVHAGREDLAEQGVHVPALDRSTTHPIASVDEAFESMDALLEGDDPTGDAIYQRLHNQTVDRFERAFANLADAEGAAAFASGMAAITATLLAARSEGNHVVAVRPLYGGTDHLLSSGLLGIDVTWARPDEVADAITPETSLVFAETPTNPTLTLVDIANVVDQAGDVPVAIDSTFATPILQRPIAHGAALSIHSATKFIGGHGDLVGGIVATRAPTDGADESWLARLRQIRIATGGLMSPSSAYEFHRGLQTLALRVETAQENAIILADRLRDHPAVERVHYPGLHDPEERALLQRQAEGPGSVLSFVVEGGRSAAKCVLEAVRLITPAVSLGCTDTLIQHPAGLTHRAVDEDVRHEFGVVEGLLRLAVGIENVDDLWEDLWRALNTLS